MYVLAVCVINSACYRVVVVSQLDRSVSGSCCMYIFSYSIFMERSVCVLPCNGVTLALLVPSSSFSCHEKLCLQLCL